MRRVESSVETVPYTYCPPGEGNRQTRLKKQLTIPIVSNTNQLSEPQRSSEPIMATWGYGHTFQETQRTVDFFTTQGIHMVSPIFPLRELPRGSTALVDARSEMPHLVVDYIRERGELLPDQPLLGFGHSKGGAELGQAIRSYPNDFRAASFLASAGFRLVQEGDAMGLPRELIQRFGENGRYQSLRERENWRAARGILLQLAYDSLSGRFPEMVNCALTLNLQEVVTAFAERGNNVGIFVGENDPVFPPRETHAALLSVRGSALHENIIFRTVPGAHDSPNSTRGRAQLLQAFSFLQEQEIFVAA